jgi:hypothetical protein
MPESSSGLLLLGRNDSKDTKLPTLIVIGVVLPEYRLSTLSTPRDFRCGIRAVGNVLQEVIRGYI